MQISLNPSLASDVYVVVWQAQSVRDGQISSGWLSFKIAAADGSVPTLKGPIPGLNVAGAPGTASQLDLVALLNLLMLALVDLGTIFWVGVQLWRAFVSSEDLDQEQRTLDQQAEARFDARFAQPVLRVLFLANIGVLLGKALQLNGGQWNQLFSPELLTSLAERYGTFWAIREASIALAMLLGLYTIFVKQRPRLLNELLPWINLLLALALLIAMAFADLSEQAAGGQTALFTVLVSWLHWLAAALWVGGIGYLALVYLPVLKGHSPVEQARSILGILLRSSSLVIAGMIIMLISGLFSTSTHITLWEQLYQSAYGRALLVKSALSLVLLIVSVLLFAVFLPRLQRMSRAYEQARDGQDQATDAAQAESAPGKEVRSASSGSEAVLNSPNLKLLAQSLGKQGSRFDGLLRWSTILGLAIVLCTATMSTFADSLIATSGGAKNQNQAQSGPFSGTEKTSDNKFSVTLSVAPNRIGPNTFFVRITDSSGNQSNNVSVSLYISMIDMDMGTEKLEMQADGKGNFSGSGTFSMEGRWLVRVQIKASDGTLHEARFTLTAASQ
jgi:copper transport protein